MNLPSLIVLLLIVSLVLFFLVRSFKGIKSGESQCSGCTVTSCPLSSYAVKAESTLTDSDKVVCCQKDIVDLHESSQHLV